MTPQRILLLPLALLFAACGTVATPVFQEDIDNTEIAQVATSDAETAAAPTATFTTAPSETPLPTDTPTTAPTNTLVPPTATSAPPSETPAPTEPPTETTGGGETEITGDPANGQILFTTFQAQASFACNTCHLVDSEAQLIGPGLQNVATRAESRVPGQSAVEYLHNSIVHPSDFVVPGFPDLLMPQMYAQIFTEDQINDLVAYLLTLG